MQTSKCEWYNKKNDEKREHKIDLIFFFYISIRELNILTQSS